MRYRKRNNVVILLIILLTISIGYAVLSTQLNINGTAKVSGNSWNVYWNNIDVTYDSVDAAFPVLEQNSGGDANAKITWSATFDLPGDFYEFTVDAVNDGTIDAVIDEVENTVTPSLPSYINYSITYVNGTEIAEGQTLMNHKKRTYKVRVEFLDSITIDEYNAIPDGGLSYSFSFGVNYVQGFNIPPEIDSCPGCVFGFTTGFYVYSDYDCGGYELTRSVLSDYTNDYRTLKNNGVQRTAFLGFIIDNNNTIEKAFSCGIKNYGQTIEKAFCIEGVVNYPDARPDIYENNKILLQSSELYDDICTEDLNNYPVTFDCSDNRVSASVDTNGTATVSDSNNTCVVDYYGNAWCS